MHEKVRTMYSWLDVASRTEHVYDEITKIRKPTLGTRLARYRSSGPFAGILVCVIVTLLHFMWRLCEYFWPADQVEVCPDIILKGKVATTPGGLLGPLRSRRARISAVSSGDLDDVPK